MPSSPREGSRARGERRKQLEADFPPAAEPSGVLPVGERDPAFVRQRKRLYLAWAQLLRRVWGPGVLACPGCGAAMKVLGAVTKPSAVERILRHPGLFDRSRPPNAHDCPTPPVDAQGQGLLAFPARELASRPAPPSIPRTRIRGCTTMGRWIIPSKVNEPCGRPTGPTSPRPS